MSLVCFTTWVQLQAMSFKDKVVIVTGASSGIGAATAVSFAGQGANVVLVARNQAKLDNVTSLCFEAGKKPLVINADVVKEEDAKRVIEETLKAYGKIDVLVNNAGKNTTVTFGSQDTMAALDDVMTLNYRAVVHLTYLALPYLLQSQGNIINVSSIASTKTFPNGWAYCPSKAAVDSFTKSLALELGPKGVRVNAVNPGPVKTDIIDNMGIPGSVSDKVWESMKAMTALHRVSETQEVADVILFLASDKARGVTASRWITDNGAQAM